MLRGGGDGETTTGEEKEEDLEEAIVQEILREGRGEREERGERPEWNQHVGWHRKEDIVGGHLLPEKKKKPSSLRNTHNGGKHDRKSSDTDNSGLETIQNNDLRPTHHGGIKTEQQLALVSSVGNISWTVLAVGAMLLMMIGSFAFCGRSGGRRRQRRFRWQKLHAKGRTL